MRHRVAATEDDGPAARKESAVADARAEMPSPAPADAPQPVQAEPTLKMVRTVPVREADAAAEVPPAPAPVVAGQGANQGAPDQPAPPRQADVATPPADAPAASAAPAAVPLAAPAAAPDAELDGGKDRMATWLGMLLMALGLVALLSAILRRALWPARPPNARTERPAMAYDGRNDPSFRRSASASRRPPPGEARFPERSSRVAVTGSRRPS